jgi:hypothetical protein
MAQPKPEEPPVRTSVAIPAPIDRLWTTIAQERHINKTTVLILAIQEYAKREGIECREPEEAAA